MVLTSIYMFLVFHDLWLQLLLCAQPSIPVNSVASFCTGGFLGSSQPHSSQQVCMAYTFLYACTHPCQPHTLH